MDNFQDIVQAGAALVTAVIGLGVVISRYTKTDKDDAFFGRLAAAFFFKKVK